VDSHVEAKQHSALFDEGQPFITHQKSLSFSSLPEPPTSQLTTTFHFAVAESWNSTTSSLGSGFLTNCCRCSSALTFIKRRARSKGHSYSGTVYRTIWHCSHVHFNVPLASSFVLPQASHAQMPLRPRKFLGRRGGMLAIPYCSSGGAVIN
jgi:hypothetical protein